MNCKKIRELLKTDYLDGEASEKVAEQVRKHLSTCPDCKAFEHMLEATVSCPFKESPESAPPERVWLRIMEAITTEQSSFVHGSLSRIARWAKARLVFNRPALAFSAAITLVFMIVLYTKVTLNRGEELKDYLAQESQFLLSLQGTANGDFEEETGLGTSIEKYLF